ncbi:MAG: DM13 domain-containing protein [Cyanobacteria bacterium J06638_7]
MNAAHDGKLTRRVPALGCLLALALAGAALSGCGEGQKSTAQSSPAATATDSAAMEADPQAGMQRSGAFVDGEHPTTGTARLLQQDGSTTLELDEAFSTSSSGPDLVVALHRSADVIGSTTPPAFPINEGDYVVLARLQSTSGAQSYAVPPEIQTDEFESAVIWCRRFNATFGAARLVPQP